jgi:sialate O-acetylesterase
MVLVSLVAILAICSQTLADVKLPSVIAGNMVLQQKMKVPIWGWADPGEKVQVQAGWQWFGTSTKADKDGKWMVKIKTPKAGGPHKIVIKGNNTIELENVLIGEVWVCSGQSNMQWAVKNSSDADKEIASADYPNIRLFKVQLKTSQTIQSDCKGDWKICSPEAVPLFSAVAYFYGRELHQQLNVPIGLIQTAWGGTPAESWTAREYFAGDSELEPIVERFNEAVKNYPQAYKQYQLKLGKWKKAVAKAKSEGKKLPRRPRLPFGEDHQNAPSGIYNAMVAPLIPYGIQGAIWYQGESNASRAYQYRKLFPAMIKSWRDNWDQGDFPFLFVQLANFRPFKPQPAEDAWAELREAQLMTLSLPNTGMAVTIDIGNPNDIHPKNKQDVGKRLALWAMAKTYNKDIVYSSPVYKSQKIEGNKVVLNFDHIGSGLISKGSDKLEGFAIAGADRKFIWADAKIVGDTVVVTSSEVEKPVAVRYAWQGSPKCNLYNKEGLPASPFRTDDWPGATLDKR